MKLTKYQKARLLEFEWNIHVDESGIDSSTGGNTCWLQIDKKDTRVFRDIKKLLGYEMLDIEDIKILVVASQVTTKPHE